ncbi:MAG: hypothetical protein AB8I08_12270 [Sandaracinaceae bacterium]
MLNRVSLLLLAALACGLASPAAGSALRVAPRSQATVAGLSVELQASSRASFIELNLQRDDGSVTLPVVVESVMRLRGRRSENLPIVSTRVRSEGRRAPSIRQGWAADRPHALSIRVRTRSRWRRSDRVRVVVRVGARRVTLERRYGAEASFDNPWDR